MLERRHAETFPKYSIRELSKKILTACLGFQKMFYLRISVWLMFSENAIFGKRKFAQYSKHGERVGLPVVARKGLGLPATLGEA